MKIAEDSKIFLTGSSGVIGSRIARHLHEWGRLICFDSNEPRDAVEGAEYHIGDVNDCNHLAELMAGADAVVHMAAIPTPSRGSSREIMRINVLGSFNVFSAAVQNRADNCPGKLQLHNTESRKEPEKRHEQKKKYIILEAMMDTPGFFRLCFRCPPRTDVRDLRMRKIFLTGQDNGKGVETMRIARLKLKTA